jgi:competence protein ComEC
VELPDGRNLLYDAGCLGSPSRASRAVAATLWDRGITHLDALILTHGDLDHYNAVPSLLERFSVGTIYIPPDMYAQPNPATDALQQAIRRSGVPVEVVQAGDRLGRGGDFSLEILHPPRTWAAPSDNAASLVLMIEQHGHRILLTGDLEGPGLDALLEETAQEVDVLLAPHHGGRRSNTPQLAQWCSPEWVVVSGRGTPPLEYSPDDPAAGELAELRSTYADAVDGPVRLLHTGRQGRITAEIGENGLTFRSRQ